MKTIIIPKAVFEETIQILQNLILIEEDYEFKSGFMANYCTNIYNKNFLNVLRKIQQDQATKTT